MPEGQNEYPSGKNLHHNPLNSFFTATIILLGSDPFFSGDDGSFRVEVKKKKMLASLGER